MQALEISGNEINPSIYLNHLENKFVISGESRPENPLKYYEPVFTWFKEYFNYLYVLNDLDSTKATLSKALKVDFDYFNSTSAKVMFDLFLFLNKEGKDKFKINFEIDWFYYMEDEDMFDAGKEMEKLCGLKFNYHPKL